MRIALFCATRRGLLFLRKLKELAPQAELVVFSFRETPGEPLFLEEIRRETQSAGQWFCEVRRGSADEVAPALAQGFDLLFAVSWRYLIPPEIYQRARIGSFALHDSLLPKSRGFSPTIWAIINGQTQTGATLFEMTRRADEGAIVDQLPVPICDEDTIAQVLERVTGAYLRLLERNLPALLKGQWQSRPQDHSQASYCRKRRPEDNRIDWNRPMREVLNLVRALTRPYPGAFAMLDGRRLMIWSAAAAALSPGRHPTPGEVIGLLGGRPVVAAADGALELLEARFDDDAAPSAAEALIRPGVVLG